MFKKKVRHINRYREIAAALFSQGFDYIVEEIGLLQKIPYYQRVRPVISAGGTGTYPAGAAAIGSHRVEYCGAIFPVVGIGFGIAMLLFGWLLYAIIRSGKL